MPFWATLCKHLKNIHFSLKVDAQSERSGMSHKLLAFVQSTKPCVTLKSIKSRQIIPQKRQMIQFTLNKIVENSFQHERILLFKLYEKKLYAFIPPPHPILKLLQAKFSIPVFTSTTLQVSCTSLFHSYHTSDICSSQKIRFKIVSFSNNIYAYTTLC